MTIPGTPLSFFKNQHFSVAKAPLEDVKPQPLHAGHTRGTSFSKELEGLGSWTVDFVIDLFTILWETIHSFEMF